MTEGEWLVSEDPAAMLKRIIDHGGGEWPAVQKASDRKLRLFACAVARLKRPGADVEVAESAVEAGQPNHNFNDQHNRTAGLFWKVCRSSESAALACAAYPTADVAALLRDVVGNPFAAVVLPESVTGEPTVQTLAAVAYECRREDGTLDPARLAVLSDALEEAGCVGDECRRCKGKGWYAWRTPDDTGFGRATIDVDCDDCQRAGRLPSPLLAHLRSPTPHYRGMWSLDLVLGKS